MNFRSSPNVFGSYFYSFRLFSLESFFYHTTIY